MSGITLKAALLFQGGILPALALLILFISATSTWGSLVQNGDFKIKAGTFPKAWAMREGVQVPTKEEEGKSYLSLNTKSDAERLRIFQTLPHAELVKGKRFVLRALCRSSEANVYGALLLNVVGENGRHSILRIPLETKKANQWELLSEEVVIQEQVTLAEVVIERRGRVGVLDIAGIELNSVDSKDKLTLFSVLRSGISLNGDPGDAMWNTLQQGVDFVVVGGTEKPALSSQETSFRSAYAQDALFLRLEMKQKLAVGTDLVEIWLGPEGSEGAFRQFIIQSDGQTSSYIRTAGRIDAKKIPYEAKVTPLSDGWMAEFKVTFAALETAAPKDNERWSFNIARQWRGEGGLLESASWARVAAFDQKKGFGYLAFYSRDQVDADLAYWENNDNDPLLRRVTVSGIEIARELEGEPQKTSLWTYDGFLVDRDGAKKWNCLGLTDRVTAERIGQAKSAEADYPEFFKTAHRLNLSLIGLARAEDSINSLRRAEYYRGRLAQGLTDVSPSIRRIEGNLDEAFQFYSAAFKAEWNPSLLKDAGPRLDSADSETKELHENADGGLSSLQDEARGVEAWSPPNNSLEWSDERRDDRGAPHRFWVTGMRTFGSGPVAEYFGPFRSLNIDWPFTMAESLSAGVFTRPRFIEARKKLASDQVNFQILFGQRGYQAPTTTWLEEEIVKDPEILASSQDQLPIPRTEFANTGYFTRRGINIASPVALWYAGKYISDLVADANRQGRVDFVLTGWEDSLELNFPKDGKYLKRQRGYDSLSRKAFQEYLKKRYGSIEELKRRWHVSEYRDFSDVPPASDRFIESRRTASGLTYEWNRWQRQSHFDWMRTLRAAVKKGGENVPVVIDNSSVFMEGNAWEALRDPATDILSFHYNPTNEDAMFAYLGSLARRKGVPLASFENYSLMYSRLEGEDERLAQLSMRRYYFDIMARDVRGITPWIGYLRNPTAYVMAYGGGWMRLDNDQTILRWPSTEFRVFMDRMSRVEKALVESKPLEARMAVFIPDASNIQTEYLHGPASTEFAMDPFIKFQNRILTEKNIPAEYLHEEMLIDGQDDLSKYDALFVANAPYINRDALARIAEWASQPGKTLFVLGPLGFFDEYAQALPGESSPLRKSFPQIAVSSERPWKILETIAPGEALLDEAPFGEGRIVRLRGSMDDFSANPDQMIALQKILVDAIPTDVTVDQAGIRIFVRKGTNDTFLLVSNRDVHQSKTFRVRVAGKFTHALDILIPGGFPVKSRLVGDDTIVDCFLDSGDWTIIQLFRRSSVRRPATSTSGSPLLARP